MSKLALWLLGACYLVLGAWAVHEWQRDHSALPPEGDEITNAVAKPFEIIPPEITFPTLDAFSDTLERPLFQKGRRSISEPEEPMPRTSQTVQRKTVQNLRLTAILTQGDRQYVLLESTGREKSTRATVGDTVDGWEITAISSDMVELKSGSQLQQLHLHVFDKPQRRPPNPRVARRTARQRAGPPPGDAGRRLPRPLTSSANDDRPNTR
ncbi:MAG: hypothetical protein ABW066_15210 [Sedimenticola sp.]